MVCFLDCVCIFFFAFFVGSAASYIRTTHYLSSTHFILSHCIFFFSSNNLLRPYWVHTPPHRSLPICCSEHPPPTRHQPTSWLHYILVFFWFSRHPRTYRYCQGWVVVLPLPPSSRQRFLICNTIFFLSSFFSIFLYFAFSLGMYPIKEMNEKRFISFILYRLY